MKLDHGMSFDWTQYIILNIALLSLSVLRTPQY